MAYCDVGMICTHKTAARWRDVSAYGNPLFCLLSLLKVTHYCLAQLVQMTIGFVTDLWYEIWFRDTACKFLWGHSQYFPSYLIIERSEAFNPVTLRGEPSWDKTKTMSSRGDCQGRTADLRDSFERISWLYLLFKCGIKTKTHFEWLLWHCLGSWVRSRRPSPCYKMPAPRPECLQRPGLAVLFLILHFALCFIAHHQAAPRTPNDPMITTSITAAITDITKRNSSLSLCNSCGTLGDLTCRTQRKTLLKKLYTRRIATTILMMLLLCNDVELNPGPTNQETVYPCGTCQLTVNWSQKAVCCDTCDVWYIRHVLAYCRPNTQACIRLTPHGIATNATHTALTVSHSSRTRCPSKIHMTRWVTSQEMTPSFCRLDASNPIATAAHWIPDKKVPSAPWRLQLPPLTAKPRHTNRKRCTDETKTVLGLLPSTDVVSGTTRLN